MTQESAVSEPAIRWVGDSPNPNANVTRSIFPIGCSKKGGAKKTTLALTTVDDDEPVIQLSDSPEPSVNRPSESSDNEAPSGSRHALVSPNKVNVQRLFDPTASTTAANSGKQLLQKLKSLILEKKKPPETPVEADDSAAGTTLTNYDVSLLTVGNAAFPNTSTPTTTAAPLPRTDRSDIVDSGHRRRVSFKPHRLVMPDEPDEFPKRQRIGAQTLNKSADDDSFFASVDVDALIDDNRKRRTAVPGGTQFKRCKTTGDISDSEIKKTDQNTAGNRQQRNERKAGDDFDDDSFFASQVVLAEVRKLENERQKHSGNH